jgi:tetratricopeptide (TPR) repeat protein
MLAACIRRQERWDDAVEAYRHAIAAGPKQVEGYHELGKLLFELARLPEAETLLRHAITLQPKNAELHTDLGRLVADKGETAEALNLYDRALALDPTFAQAHLNRGTLLQHQLKHDEALAAYRAALAVKPDLPEAHLNAAMVLLSQRKFAEGWTHFAWRWRNIRFPFRRRRFPQPEWDCTAPVTGKLLVWGEQGPGDEILFASMIPDLCARDIPVVLECDPRLVPLFARAWPSVTVVARTTPPDPATADAAITQQIAAGSLGAILRPDAASFPRRPHFLTADPGRVADVRRRLVNLGRPRVGIAWASRNLYFGAHKTTSLAAWAPILAHDGVDFVDVQYGDTADERAAIKATVQHLPDLDLFNDLDGLAALLSACDLVIAVSSTTAHLAGALGVPVWVLTSAGAGQLWPWFAAGDTTPFYPSARIFRQQSPGDWKSVVSEIAAALRQRF